MFVDMETERGNTGPESEVGMVWTGIETPEEEWNRTSMVFIRCVKGERGREGGGEGNKLVHTYVQYLTLGVA